MNADDFRDYMLSFLFLRYLSDNYEIAAKKELGKDYPRLATPDGLRRSASMHAEMVAERREPSGDDARVPLAVWYDNNKKDVREFEK
jgi:type I restriction enzyme M protein